jgi:hypothetical protein
MATKFPKYDPIIAALAAKQPLATVLTGTTASFTEALEAKLTGIEAGAQSNAALASQAEAEAGENNVKTMTPLRVAQAIAALAEAGPGGDGTSNRATITQAAHGFASQQAVFNNNGTWALSVASSIETSRVDAVVESVTTNNFVAVFGGNITLSGLTPNSQYYLSDSTAGLISTSHPSSESSFVVAVLRSGSSSSAYVEIDTPLSLAKIQNNDLASDAQRPQEVTQNEAEAGVQTALRSWSPARVKQAIDALAGSGGSVPDIAGIIWPRALSASLPAGFSPCDGTNGTLDLDDVGTAMFIQRIAPDTTSPEVLAVSINTSGTQATISFDEEVEFGVGGNGGFVLNRTSGGGGTVSLSYVSGGGGTALVYTTEATVYAGETFTLQFTQPSSGVQDVAGNPLVSFSGQAVTNNSTEAATVQPEIWLRADSLSGTGGADYSSAWTDASGNSYSAQGIAGNYPSLSSDTLNGYNYLRFVRGGGTGGTSEMMQFSGSGLSVSKNVGGLTAILVWRRTASSGLGGGHIFAASLGNSASAHRMLISHYSANSGHYTVESRRADGASWWSTADAGIFTNNEWHVLAVRIDFIAGTVKSWHNTTAVLNSSALPSPGSNTSNTNSAWSGFGANSGATTITGTTADYAEVMFFDTAISDVDRESWTATLRAKYAI